MQLEQSAGPATVPTQGSTSAWVHMGKAAWRVVAVIVAVAILVLLMMKTKQRAQEEKRTSRDATVSRATFVAIRLEDGALGAFVSDPETARVLGAAAYHAATAAGMEIDLQTKRMLQLVMSGKAGVPLNIGKVFWARYQQGHVQQGEPHAVVASQLTLTDSHGRYVARNANAYVVSARLHASPAIVFVPSKLGEPATAMAWRGPGQIDSVAIAPNSSEVVIVTTEGLALKADFSASSPTLVEADPGAAAPSTALLAPFFGATALDPTGRFVATSQSNVVTVRAIAEKGHVWRATLPDTTEEARALWLAPTGRLAVWSSVDTLHVWDPPEQFAPTQAPPEGRSRGSAPLAGDLRDVAFSADARRMVTLTPDEIRLWDADAVLQLLAFDASAARAAAWRDVVLSADGRRIAARSSNGLVARWSADRGQVDFQHKLGQLPPTVTFSPDVRYLLLLDRGSARAIDLDVACSDKPLKELASGIPSPSPGEFEGALEDLVPALAQGIDAAREGRLGDAEKHLRDAETWPGVHFSATLRDEIRKIRIDALAERALRSSGEGDVRGLEASIDQLQSLGEAAEQAATDASRRLASTHVRRGFHESENGRYTEAAQEYREAAEEDPEAVSPAAWNNLCWAGAVHDEARVVLFACDEAVAQAGTTAWQYRDSRGVARGMSRDFPGAIEDLQYVVEHWPGSAPKRAEWLAMLRAKKNPFVDESVLEELRSE